DPDRVDRAVQRLQYVRAEHRQREEEQRRGDRAAGEVVAGAALAFDGGGHCLGLARRARGGNAEDRWRRWGRSPPAGTGASVYAKRDRNRFPLFLVSGATEFVPQLVLRLFEHLLALLRQVLAGAVDVEGEHGHGRAEGLGLALLARLGGFLQRSGDLPGIVGLEQVGLERQRVAVLGDLVRPFSCGLFCGGHGWPSSSVDDEG